jgi:hypothetical protein
MATTANALARLDIAPRFWELIDASKGNAATMESLLAEMSRLDLARFNEEFNYAIADLVAQAAKKSMDRHTAQEIAGWVISRGSAFFAKALEDPSLFPDEVPDWKDNFFGLVDVVFEERFGEAVPEQSGCRWLTHRESKP